MTVKLQDTDIPASIQTFFKEMLHSTDGKSLENLLEKRGALFNITFRLNEIKIPETELDSYIDQMRLQTLNEREKNLIYLTILLIISPRVLLNT